MKLEHHAYLIIGEAGELIADLKNSHPSARHHKFERLGIDDSRALAADQSQTAWSGEIKLFILEIVDATVEAQNALLKMLEEPTAGTHFILIVPSAEILLSTVRSRLQKISPPPAYRQAGQPSSQRGGEHAQEFLKMIPAKRLEWLKNTELPSNFLDQLEQVIAEKKDLTAYAELALVRKKWHIPGASHKLLLEHLAVTLPVFVLR